ncbi:hypothetical protein R6Z07F_003312 [Ovis aries]
METAGLGRALPGRPVLLAPRPPGRALRSSLRRKGTSPSGENGASWPQGGWQGPRGGLKLEQETDLSSWSWKCKAVDLEPPGASFSDKQKLGEELPWEVEDTAKEDNWFTE